LGGAVRRADGPSRRLTVVEMRFGRQPSTQPLCPCCFVARRPRPTGLHLLSSLRCTNFKSRPSLFTPTLALGTSSYQAYCSFRGSVIIRCVCVSCLSKQLVISLAPWDGWRGIWGLLPAPLPPEFGSSHPGKKAGLTHLWLDFPSSLVCFALIYSCCTGVMRRAIWRSIWDVG
jgi:hypothetical protein